MNLRVELATHRDLKSVIEIRKSAILTGARSALPEEEVVAWAGKRKEAEIREQIGQGEIWVARSSSGSVEAWVRADNEKVEGLYVAGQHQRSGVGRGLLLFIEKRMAQEGVEMAHVDAALNAIEFYRSCGYTELSGKRFETTQGMGKTLQRSNDS
jgi:GNAT superfamily N-acetyltransferase